MNLDNGICGPEGCPDLAGYFTQVCRDINGGACSLSTDTTGTCICTNATDHGWLAFRVVIGSCCTVALLFYLTLSRYVTRITR